MNTVEHAIHNVRQWFEFVAIIKAFDNSGITRAYICKQIGGRGDDYPKILPQPRITKIMQGNGFPTAEQMAALIGLAKREGIKWKRQKSLALTIA